MKTTTALLLLGTVVAGGCDGTGGDKADLVFRGGVVWTGVSGADPAEGLAVKDGRITAVGSDADISGMIGTGTRIIDLHGRALVPGFIDSHTHFISGGFQLSSVDLRDADTPEEFARRIGDFAAGLPSGA